MAKCSKLDEMAELANRFFAARMKAIPLSHQRVNRALTDWLASAPRPAPDMVSQHLKMSARQVERIANRYWGAPPRTLDRINRALSAAASICAGTDAVEAFSDASHMIREVKRVTGHTPRQLQSLRLNPYHRLHPPKVRDCNSDSGPISRHAFIESGRLCGRHDVRLRPPLRGHADQCRPACGGNGHSVADRAKACQPLVVRRVTALHSRCGRRV